MFASPASDLREHRQKADAHFGQVVDRALPVARVAGLDDDPPLDQHFQTAGEDIGGDTLVRLQQNFAKMTPSAEDHVANDQQAPLIADDLEREVDRAA